LGALAEYLSGVFVNVGSALGLAALLVWFERSFVRTVQTAARATAQREVTHAVETALQPIRSDIAGLNERLASRDTQRRKDQDRLVQDALMDPSHKALGNLVLEAAARGAIGPMRLDDGTADEDGFEVTVPAGTAETSPFITMRCFPKRAKGHLVLLARDVGPEAYVRWQSDTESVDDVMSALKQAMLDGGGGVAARDLDGEALLVNLVAALDLALKSRAADDEGWLSGTPLYEWIAENLALSESGAELKDQGVVAPRSQFGHWSKGTSGSSRYIPTNLGPAPANVDKDMWDTIARRGDRYFSEGRPGWQ
jgi:type II secretory pathway pseudopilin PulG